MLVPRAVATRAVRCPEQHDPGQARICCLRQHLQDDQAAEAVAHQMDVGPLGCANEARQVQRIFDSVQRTLG